MLTELLMQTIYGKYDVKKLLVALTVGGVLGFWANIILRFVYAFKAASFLYELFPRIITIPLVVIEI